MGTQMERYEERDNGPFAGLGLIGGDGGTQLFGDAKRSQRATQSPGDPEAHFAKAGAPLESQDIL